MTDAIDIDEIDGKEDIERIVSQLNTEINRIDGNIDTAFTQTTGIRQEISEIKERLDAIEQVIEPNTDRTQYDQLTREQKVYKIRKTLLKQATERNGRTSMKYDEIKALFDGHPSDGHCYDLMNYAARADGYDVKDKPKKRIVVNSVDVNDKALIHAVNTHTNESTV